MPPSRAARPKVKIGITIDAELYEWVLEHIGPGGEFASVSHALERALAAYRNEATRRESHSRGGKAHG